MTGDAVQRAHWRWLGAVATALLIHVPVAAQQGPNTLRGRVIDETNRPVPFAQIEMLPGDRRIVTDQNGDFAIAGLENGEYELRLRRVWIFADSGQSAPSIGGVPVQDHDDR